MKKKQKKNVCGVLKNDVGFLWTQPFSGYTDSRSHVPPSETHIHPRHGIKNFTHNLIFYIIIRHVKQIPTQPFAHPRLGTIVVYYCLVKVSSFCAPC